MPVIPWPSPEVPRALRTLIDKIAKFPSKPGAVLQLSPEEAEAWDWLVSIGWKPHVHWIVTSGDRWMRFVDPLPQAEKQPYYLPLQDLRGLVGFLDELTGSLARVVEAVEVVKRALRTIEAATARDSRAQEQEKGGASTCSDAE